VITHAVSHNTHAAPLAQSTTIPTGSFTGSVAPEEPIALGTFDLVIMLADTNGTLSGTVDTELTQVFHGAAAPTLTGQISGTDDEGNPTFTLRSESFRSTISRRPLIRSFSLQGSILNDGATLRGQYTETIDGFTPEPLSVSGEFLLVQALGSQSPEDTSDPRPIDGDEVLYLPLVQR
jgi:hypothetical protein